MRGVSRTEGMRRRCASRRTVDSLTCRISASCFAVRNSSRSDMGLRSQVYLAYGVSTGSGSDRASLLPIYNCQLPIGRNQTMNRQSAIGNRQSAIGNWRWCDAIASTTPRGLPARGPRTAPGTDFILVPAT